MPGICWYPAKRTGMAREIKVAPRIVIFVLDRDPEGSAVRDVFMVLHGKLWDSSQATGRAR